jgi:hypothetical protein
MNNRRRSLSLWIAAIILTLAIVVYQRITGPTHPVRGSAEVAGEKIKYKLLTSHETDGDAPVIVKSENSNIKGRLLYKRQNTEDDWRTIPMKNVDGKLEAALPVQPAAGKLAYQVKISYMGETISLTEDPVVIRFTGVVPLVLLIPHIIFMFSAMLFSTRTGLEALYRGKQTLTYAAITLITLFAGGLILGPAIQYLAFGDIWAGWPFGGDLTDNKTAVAFIFWLIAVIRLRKKPEKQTWALIAALVLLAVYLVPHSVLGSEFDYSTGEVVTGN